MNESACVWAGINSLVQLEPRVCGWEREKMRPEK